MDILILVFLVSLGNENLGFDFMIFGVLIKWMFCFSFLVVLVFFLVFLFFILNLYVYDKSLIWVVIVVGFIWKELNKYW